MIDIKTGKEIENPAVLKAPLAGSANATVGGMMRGVGARLAAMASRNETWIKLVDEVSDDRIILPVYHPSGGFIETEAIFIMIRSVSVDRRALFGYGAMNTDYVDIESSGKLGQGIDESAQINHIIQEKIVYRVIAKQTEASQTIRLENDSGYIGENTYTKHPGFSNTNLGLFSWNGNGGYERPGAKGRYIAISKIKVNANGVVVFDGIGDFVDGFACIRNKIDGSCYYGAENRSNFEVYNK